MTSLAEGILIGVPAIARIADVGVNAVSNWRNRHKDFPTPVMKTPSLLFDAGDIEAWLIENEKIHGRVKPWQLIEPFIDQLRSDANDLGPEQLGELVGSLLALIAAYERITASEDQGAELPDDSIINRLRALHPTTPISDLLPEQLLQLLRDFVSDVRVDGWGQVPISAGLEHLDRLQPDSALRLVRLLLGASTLDGHNASELIYSYVWDRIRELDRFTEESATPASISELLGVLAKDAKSVFDPACGEAGALLRSARRATRVGTPGTTVIGWEVNRQVCARAAIRFLLAEIPATIQPHDSLRDLPMPTGIDVVIADPPMAGRDWGDADVYTSQRWVAGSPPASSADFAWIQVALEPLVENGRAYVVLRDHATYSGGREADIRRTLLRNGQISAVVHLPSRLFQRTSIPTALWCLRRTARPSGKNDVLLVDASRLGSAGRSTVTLSSTEIHRLAALIRTWETDHRVNPGGLDIDTAVLNAADADEDTNLTVARYFTPPEADLPALMAKRDAAITELLELARDTQRGLADLCAAVAPVAGQRPGASPRAVGLTEVADLLRAPGSARRTTSDQSATARDAAERPRPEPDDAPILEEGDVIVLLLGRRVGSATLADPDRVGSRLGRDELLVRVHRFENRVTPEWIATVLNSEYVHQRLDRLATRLGAAQRIHWKHVAELEVPEFTDDADQFLHRRSALASMSRLQHRLGLMLGTVSHIDSHLTVAAAYETGERNR